MKILYYMPPAQSGAGYWIYLGWKHGFEACGHQFYEWAQYESIQGKIRQVAPDIVFISNFIDLTKTYDMLCAVRRRGTKVFLVVDWPMKTEWVEIIRQADVADVFFGEREPESMQPFQTATRRDYHLIPNAADPRLHVPGHKLDKYECDIVYVGAYLPQKKRMFRDILLPLKKRYRVRILGPYWTVQDNLLRALQAVSRRANAHTLADAVNQMRIRIPPEEESLLYASAKICVNFHERAGDGSQPHYIVNQRAFKIPASGGFEICDDVPALRKYFDEDEVIMASTSEDWFNKIDYYLNNEDARKRVQTKGTARALRDHTYVNRVQDVLELAGL